MSDFDLQADGNSQGLFVDDNELFDFDAASEEVDTYQYRDILAVAEEEYFDDLSNDDDSLLGEAVSSTRDVNDEELSEEADDVTRANGVLSWKIEHSTGDHRLKGMQNDSFYLGIVSDII
jgi:hypothetical protein